MDPGISNVSGCCFNDRIVQVEGSAVLLRSRSSFALSTLVQMSQFESISKAPGFVDKVGPMLEIEELVTANAREILSTRGYEPIRTPILESSELFLRRSGGVLASQMYDFVAPDGASLSLRPEMTAPVIRHALETQSDTAFPSRYQYAGPVFRYPDGSDGRSVGSDSVPRQFTQVGAEVVGASGPEYDGEVIAVAVEVAGAIGLPNVGIVLSDVGLMTRLLNRFSLANRAHLFLMRNLARLSTPSGAVAVREQAAEMQLASSEGCSAALEAMERLAKISGESESALGSVAGLCDENGLPGADTVAPLRQIIDAAVNEGVDPNRLEVNFGLDVGIEYYTNAVWGIYSGTEPKSRVPVGGGGRYDALAEALGSPVRVPALGFAVNLDDALSVLP